MEACKADGQPLEPIGYLLDSGYSIPIERLHGLPVLGGLEWLAANANRVEVIVGVGSPEARFHIARRAQSAGARFVSAVHPTATLTRWVTLAEGVVVMAGARMTSNIRVGGHSHINQNCTIGHDTVIQDFVSLHPGVNVSGDVHIRDGVLVGAGAVIVEKLTVGSWSRIGAGSIVLGSLGDNVTAVGCPARVVRVREDGWHRSSTT